MLLANTPTQGESILHCLKQVAGDIGLYVNADKTEYMCFNQFGDFYKPRKAKFFPTFCKRINRTSTAVGKWVTAFEEGRRTTFSVTKFIYNNKNNNKQAFTPNGTNNEYARVQKRIQGSDGL